LIKATKDTYPCSLFLWIEFSKLGILIKSILDNGDNIPCSNNFLIKSILVPIVLFELKAFNNSGWNSFKYSSTSFNKSS